MKTFKLLITLAVFIFSNRVYSQDSTVNRNNGNNIIQLALLLDVSGSMGGLINQAKSELWNIVNEVAKAKKNGNNSQLEIALYEYGRSTNNNKNRNITKLLDYTSDLDTVSEVLFSLRTDGSEEFCGEVIENALNELQWRGNDSIYRVIFIAGNEAFSQGVKVSYVTACSNAKERGIFINTIHCGDSLQGVKDLWPLGAQYGNGQFFNINHNKVSNDIPTPYDSMIKVYNDSINSTYWYYGKNTSYKSNQLKQDSNASKMSKAVLAKRAVSKSNKVYKNTKWDVIDASKDDTAFISKTKDEDLPKELKGLTKEKKVYAIDSASKKRQYYSSQILALNKLREKYISENTTDKKEEKTLSQALIEAIHKQAGMKGFVFGN